MTKREATRIALSIARAVISKERVNASDLTMDIVVELLDPSDTYQSEKVEQALLDLEIALGKRLERLDRETISNPV